jgi:hypothetical protein
MQSGEKQLGEMQRFNTTPLGEIPILSKIGIVHFAMCCIIFLNKAIHF